MKYLLLGKVDKASVLFAGYFENEMIVRIGYCIGEVCHDLRWGGLGASVPMYCKYDDLSHKAVYQEQDAGRTTKYMRKNV